MCNLISTAVKWGMINTNLRMSTLVTVAVLFLALGTFTSVTIQGGYQLIFAIPLIYYTHLAYGRNFRLPASAWWMLAFAVVALLSIALNWDIIPKPSKNLGRVKYFLLAAFGIFPMGVWLKVVSDRTKRRLLRCACAGVIVAGGWMLWQKFALGLELLDPLTETMRFAYGTALVAVIGTGLILQPGQHQSWTRKRWLGAALLAAVVSLWLVNSRGAMAAFLLALPLITWFWNRKVAIFVGAIGILLGSFLVWNYLYGKSDDNKVRLLNNSQNNSDQIRRSQWQAAAIAWKERPILGWGFSNFSTQLKRIKHQYDLPAKEYDDAHAHNIPLEIAAGTGTIGLALFLTAFFCWVWECWKAGGLVRAIMMPFFAAIMFEAQFEVILDANNATMIGFIYALTMATNRRYQLPIA